MKPVKKGDYLYRVCADVPDRERWHVEARVVMDIKSFQDTTYVEIRIDSPFTKMRVDAFDQRLIDVQVFRTAREALCAFDRERERVELILAAQLKNVREARYWVTAQLDTIDVGDSQ